MAISIETIPEMVARTWRDLEWTGQRVPKQGIDHAVVILDGLRSKEYELNDMLPESVVVRVPFEEEYRTQAMLESSLIAQLFRRTKVRVPGTVRQAYARGTFNTAEPVMLTMQTEVLGQPLSAELWQSLSASQRAWVAEQLGSLLATMHAFDPDVLPISRVDSWWSDGAATSTPNRVPRSLPGKLELMKQRVAEVVAPHLSAAETDFVERVFAQVDDMLARPYQQRALNHGELHEDHMLWTAEGGVGVIDFSDMTVGDPALDYAHFAGISPSLPGMVYEQAIIQHEQRRQAPAVPGVPPPMPGPLYRAPGGGRTSESTEDTDVLRRAAVYKDWDNIFLLIDHYRTGRSPRVELL
ncbi:hypothetical protein HMPREF2678_02965 [Corynebacterium sp. HMSC058E07]|uniref:phosphotransferase family protein n=1 Tax=Corynebacterium TaxID=1716 RepID=UPI0008A20302|nr:aminoglycoside phosphotransferase family protein [Corynebacterium sp. HMSC058E07]OFM61643.1 hypothetical protein HMPREF2678_02965 [Corynebacterium sp. HMSC058E07]